MALARVTGGSGTIRSRVAGVTGRTGSGAGGAGAARSTGGGRPAVLVDVIVGPGARAAPVVTGAGAAGLS